MERKDRINITPLARQIKEGSVHVISHNLWQPPVSAQREIEWFSAIKPELYALTAVFVDEITTEGFEIREEFPPFGLVKPIKNGLGYQVVNFQDLEKEFPFQSIAFYMAYTFGALIDLEIGTIESGKSSPQLESVYRRLKHLVSLGKQNLHGPTQQERYKDVKNFIHQGFSFGSTVMTGLTEVIGRLDGGLDNPQKLGRIAANSFPLVAKLTMQNTDKGGHVVNRLQGVSFVTGLPISFQPRYFAIEREGEEARLVISKAGEEHLKNAGLPLEDADSGRSPTVGCPAMVNIDGASAIKKLWDWHIDIAEKIYPHLAAKPQA